jgi:hypothetical protein
MKHFRKERMMVGAKGSAEREPNAGIEAATFRLEV